MGKSEWIPASIKPEETAKGTFCLIERNGKLYPETCYYFNKHQQDFCPDGNEDWADFENDEYYLPEGWYTLCDQCEKYWKVDVSFYMVALDYPVINSHSPEQTAIRLLRDIVDLQNGAPLERDREVYESTMQDIYSFLDSHSPTEPGVSHGMFSKWESFETLQEGDWFQGTEEDYRKALALCIDPYAMVPTYPKTCEIIGFLAYNGITCFCLEPRKTQLTPEEFLRRAENTFKTC